jgi:hypothetical protein
MNADKLIRFTNVASSDIYDDVFTTRLTPQILLMLLMQIDQLIREV